MSRNPILEEVREIRDAIAKEHEYDLGRIVRTLQEQERESGRRLVSFPPKRPRHDRLVRRLG